MTAKEITNYLTNIGYSEIEYHIPFNDTRSSFIWTDQENVMQINIDLDDNISDMINYSCNGPICPINAYYEGGCTSYSSFSIDSVATLQCIIKATHFVPYGINKLDVEQVSNSLKQTLENWRKYYEKRS